MILDRIRAHGGDVVMDRWNMRLRPGRLSPDALEWVKEHRDDLIREAWPAYDDWQERAAIMEYDGGLTRDKAEAAAYRCVTC